MQVAQISVGLKEIERRLHADDTPLLPFQIACEIYQSQIPHPFVPDELVFQIHKFREVAMFVAAGMDLVRYHHLAPTKKQMKLLRKHLRLLGPGFFGVAATYAIQQAHGSFLRDRLKELGRPIPSPQIAADAARKTIELMVGMAALSCFDEVALEDPNDSSSKAPNPDVIVRHEGCRYGIACKSLASSNEANFIDRITEGLSQIADAVEKDTVDARRGVVLVDISALLDHDRLYNGTGSQPSATPMGPGEALLSEMNAALIRIFHRAPDWGQVLHPLFAPYSLPPGILIYGHSLLICHDEQGAHLPVYQKAMMLGFGNDVEPIKWFCNRLNDALHGQVGK
jgi:hypothetical protein